MGRDVFFPEYGDCRNLDVSNACATKVDDSTLVDSNNSSDDKKVNSSPDEGEKEPAEGFSKDVNAHISISGLKKRKNKSSNKK
jgi:hypothetical protein